MALSKEKQEDFPLQVVENCACLAMRCRDADQMSDLYRVFFLHRIESITKRVKLLVKCLCEYHSTSSFMYYIFSRLTTPDASNKNLLLKFMLTLGGSSVNLSAFNLNIASSSELSFLKKQYVASKHSRTCKRICVVETVSSHTERITIRKDLRLLGKDHAETTRIFKRPSFNRPGIDESNASL